jgi:hypothetical protein
MALSAEIKVLAIRNGIFARTRYFPHFPATKSGRMPEKQRKEYKINQIYKTWARRIEHAKYSEYAEYAAEQ